MKKQFTTIHYFTKKLIVLMFVLINSTTFAQSETRTWDDVYGTPQQIQSYIPGVEPLQSRRMSISDVPPYYREAATIGGWDYFNLPSNMAYEAWKDQERGIGGGFWSTAFRTMFKSKQTINENYYGDSKRTIIYQNPSSPNSGSAYWAKQFADYGAIIMSLLIVGLIIFVVKVYYNKKIEAINKVLTIKEIQEDLTIESKMAIKNLLGWIAVKDNGVINDKPFFILRIIVEILGLNNLERKELNTLESEFSQYSNDKLLEYLSDFTSIQKGWFIRAIIYLIESDSQIEAKKDNYIQPILSNMGITKEKFNEIRNKVYQMN